MSLKNCIAVSSHLGLNVQQREHFKWYAFVQTMTLDSLLDFLLDLAGVLYITTFQSKTFQSKTFHFFVRIFQPKVLPHLLVSCQANFN